MPTFRELLFGAAPAASHQLASINESAYQAAWISTEDWHFECPICRRRTPFSEEESFLFCGHCFTHCSVSGGVKEIPDEYSFLAPINATHFCGVVTVKPERLLPGIAGNILETGCICWYPAEGTAEVLLDQDHMNLDTGRIRERIESSIRQRSPAITNIKWITIGVQTVAIKEDIERGAFEKWAKRQKSTLGGGLQIDRAPAGERWDYVTKAAESAWRAWQAARAQAEPSSGVTALSSDLSARINRVSRRSLDGSVVMSSEEWNGIVELVEKLLTAAQAENDAFRARVAGIKQIIAVEPELPGEMPEELWQAFVDAINEGDRAFVMTALRVAVKETKDCILERIREAEMAGGEQ